MLIFETIVAGTLLWITGICLGALLMHRHLAETLWQKNYLEGYNNAKSFYEGKIKEIRTGESTAREVMQKLKIG